MEFYEINNINPYDYPRFKGLRLENGQNSLDLYSAYADGSEKTIR